MATAPVLCFGEVLWDCLPRGLFLGGAPFNVACHLQALGRPAVVASAVGSDFLGEEILRRIAQNGMDTGCCPQVDAPTGFVQVAVDENGQPGYVISEGVAYDQVPVSDTLRAAAARAPALVFGSLAQRSEHNRYTLGVVREALANDALQVFDVNLRPPFDHLPLVMDLARGCDLLKLNDHEARQLLDREGEDDLQGLAAGMAERSGVESVVLTAGARGAGLYADGTWYFAAPEEITVRDTVGAGDSFLAGLLDGLLAGAEPARCLERASRLAEFVAQQDGATPSLEAAPAVARKLD